MTKYILRLGAAAFLAAAIAGAPLQLLAQTTNKAAADKKSATTKKEVGEKKKGAHPFRGKLAAVDKTAKTIKIGKSTYVITSETKITKDGKPATLADAVVDEQVTGYAKPADDGSMVATSLKIGAKAESKTGEKKKKSSK
jgi:hypothetical protein